MNKVVVVYSGGLDSTVLLTKCIKEFDEVVALNFSYGSKHNVKEREAAHKVCSKLNIELVLVDLPFVNELFKSDLLKSGGDVPEGHYADESMRRTVVPFRNGIMLSIAVGFAESVGAECVAIATHAGDHAVYKDCLPEFISSMSHTSEIGTYEKIYVYAPFVNITKAEVVAEGLKIEAPFDLSWTCYNGKDRPCLKCSTCEERIGAFYQNNIADPSLTEDEWASGVKNMLIVEKEWGEKRKND